MSTSFSQQNITEPDEGLHSVPPSLCTPVFYILAVAYLDFMPRMPHTREEALAQPDADKWRAALDIEAGVMQVNQVYRIRTLPAGASAVACRILVYIKHSSGRYNSRLAAQGFSQMHGLDYNETYAPVSSVVALCVFCVTLRLIWARLCALSRPTPFCRISCSRCAAPGWFGGAIVNPSSHRFERRQRGGSQQVRMADSPEIGRCIEFPTKRIEKTRKPVVATVKMADISKFRRVEVR